MCKKTNQSTDGTSFQGVTILTSVQNLINTFGKPDYGDNTGKDKVNFEWDLETRDGDVFTIYDWKEYRKLDLNEPIEFHIGSFSKGNSLDAQSEVLKELFVYVS
jgi:hypothetical protein